MPRTAPTVLPILESGSPAYARFLDRLLARRGAGASAIDSAVAAIIAEVRRDGDAALVRLTARFDGVTIPRTRLRVTAAELAAARAQLPAAERRALALAARRIEAFHRHTRERSFSYRDPLGMRLGQLVRPLTRVGIYVPGGLGAYPSSVLMNALPEGRRRARNRDGLAARPRR